MTSREAGQDRSGWRRLLDLPLLYRGAQGILGSAASKRRLVRDDLRPFPGMRLLDIGCGPAALLDALPRGVNYVGVDLSAAYVDAARRRYGDRGTFLCRPVSQLDGDCLQERDLILALGLLHHLDDRDAARLFARARSLLAPGGRMVTVDPCRLPRQRRVARLLLACDRGRCIRTPEAYRSLAVASFSAVEVRVDGDRLALGGRWPIPYDHCVMSCQRDAAW